MSIISVNGRKTEIDMVVFDKDGLLFDSVTFWRELAEARIKAARKKLGSAVGAEFSPEALEDLLQEWMDLMSVENARDEQGRVIAVKADPIGVLAVASPDEETAITATFFMQKFHWRWPDARETSREIFAAGDAGIDLATAIKAKKGFPGIFQRLYAAKIPYGIATSDDLDRAKRSVNMYDDFSKLEFVVTPKEVAHNKPEPDMLYLISEKYHVDCSRIMMVGDSYVDVKMAWAAGAVGIGIPEFEHVKEEMKPYAFEIISSLDDIIIEA